MGVYVERDFFESMNEICRNIDAKKKDINVCSTTVKYRSAKERLDNVHNKNISQSYNDVKNLIEMWHSFLDIVVTFIIQNYIRLKDKKSAICFQTFLDQQYQIISQYYSQFRSFEIKQKALSYREDKGFIWN